MPSGSSKPRPTPTNWWQGVLAAWHYGRGMGAFKRGRHAQAVERLRRSDAIAPSLETKAMIAKAERAVRSNK